MTRGRHGAVDAELVIRAAAARDQFFIEIVQEAGRYLGEGIARLINLFNPEKIILGGELAGAGAIAPQGGQNDEAPAEQGLRRNDMKTHRHRMMIIFWKAVSPFLYLSSLVTGSA